MERVAGLDGDKIVEAHGTFHTSHCITCQKEYSQNWIKGKYFAMNDQRELNFFPEKCTKRTKIYFYKSRVFRVSEIN